MDLNNIKLDDIKEKLLNIDKKTLIKYGSVVGAVILFLIIYYAILNPIVTNKRTQLDDMNLKNQEIIKFENDLISIKKKIKKIKPIYEKNSSLFHSKKEVEGLYQTLSQFAAANGLVVSKIDKKKPKPVFLNKKGKVTKKKPKKVTKKNVSYFTIPVKFEVKGNFLGYIRFKRELSKSNKMLNFEKELIKLEKAGSSGIVVTGELSIVGLTDEFL